MHSPMLTNPLPEALIFPTYGSRWRRRAEVSAGGSHTDARLENGSLRCWGADGSGQLGYGNTDSIGDTELPFTAGDVPL